MKLYCTIFAILLAVLSASAAGSAESKDPEANILEKAKLCQKETNATDTDVKEMLDGAEPKTKTSECLTSCVLRKLNVVKDNKLQPENLNKLIVDDTIKSKDGKTLTAIMKPVGDACKTVTHSEQCTAGVVILACLNAEAVKLGFEKAPF